MTTYNRSAFIKESIASVQAQNYTNWELLIEDDGSTDDTEEVIKQINDDRIYYTKHRHIAITGKLKNIALKKARGEFIAFIDSDDFWTSDKLSIQISLLNAHKEVKFSISNWQDFHDFNHPERPYYEATEQYFKGNIFKKYCKAERLAHIQTLLFKKECLEKTGYFNEKRLFTDYSFIGELSYHFSAVVVNKPLLLRRLHVYNSISLSWADDFKEYQETVLKYVASGRIELSEVKKTLFLSYINLGEKYKASGIKKKACSNFIDAWKYEPLSLIPLKKIIKTLFL